VLLLLLRLLLHHSLWGSVGRAGSKLMLMEGGPSGVSGGLMVAMTMEVPLCRCLLCWRKRGFYEGEVLLAARSCGAWWWYLCLAR
jgi:hypothetical protein